MPPMVGLAYFPLLLWLPILALQGVATTYLGRGAQSAVRAATGLLVETPLLHFLKIVWVVMLVLCLDCVRGALAAAGQQGSGGGVQDNTRAFEAAASKEGALVLALNLVAMVAVIMVHTLNGQCMKLEMDRDVMKRQAQQAGEFSKQLMASDEAKKTAASGVPKETTMPEAKPPEGEGGGGEVRKREQ